MKFGLFGINTGPCAQPETAVRVAQAAEAAGFDSVWTGEHVVLPDPQVPPSPSPPGMPMLDPSVALAFLAGQTTRLKLGTGIIILPQRNPVELAKELASLDVLSNGRLLFGLGAGYLEPEFRALGAPFEERGAATDEAIEVLRTLWVDEAPTFDGRFSKFSGVDAHPRPVQTPHPPIHVGGHSPPAFRRAVRQGDGWYGFFQNPEGTAQCLAGLRAADEAGLRPAGKAPLEITVSPPPGCDLDTASRYRDLGVDRLALVAIGRDEEALLRFVDDHAEALVRKLS